MLMNYIELPQDTPVRMHFTDHYDMGREIWDNDLGRMKRVQSLVFWCDELDGRPEARTFSILSRDLTARFEPFLKDNAYRMKDFVVTKTGTKFLTKYQVQVLPREEFEE